MVMFTPQQPMDLLKVYQLATTLHTGHVDHAGRPYIEHLTRVFLRVQAAGGDEMQQIAALLHDAIEDGKASAVELTHLGIPRAALDIIVSLTKLKGQSYADYLAGVKSNPKALLVKLADVDDNGAPERLAVLPDALSLRLQEKYASAALYLNAKPTG